MATEPSSHHTSSSTTASAPYSHPSHPHHPHEAYDSSFFAASTSSTPPVNSYPPYLGGSHSSTASFTPYPPTPYSNASLAPPIHAYSNRPAMSNPSSSTAPPAAFPGIGRIRCYWTILTPQLEYVYLDPTLAYHMGEWSNAFRGSNVLDWVHPDEREQLADDLLPKEDRIAGVESAGVFGSVTRCVPALDFLLAHTWTSTREPVLTPAGRAPLQLPLLAPDEHPPPPRVPATARSGGRRGVRARRRLPQPRHHDELDRRRPQGQGQGGPAGRRLVLLPRHGRCVELLSPSRSSSRLSTGY